MVNDFNEYAEEQNLNVTLTVTIFTEADLKNFEAFANAVETLLAKKSRKYDLYYYDNAYTVKYGPHLLDLKRYLSKDQISMYNRNIIEMSCIYEDKLVGLVNITI